MLDMADAARKLGIETYTLELGPVWEARKRGESPDPGGMAQWVRERRIQAVLGYTYNGMLEWPAIVGTDGRVLPFFEQVGVRHLMWWTDHPHWAHDRAGLQPELQPMLRSANHFVFVKSELAASELREMLGWPNCFGLPVAENPERLKPVPNPNPEFDIVAIVGSPPALNPRLEPFLKDDDPDILAMADVLAPEIVRRIQDQWSADSPAALRNELCGLAAEWVRSRARAPLEGSFRLFGKIEAHFPRAAQWLRANPLKYFDAVEALWEFGRWQRTFYLRYLAKYFRVAVFGSNWSRVGIPGGGWVNHDDQPAVYSLGRVAINISQAGEEEGLAHKPFHMAACGVPMAHIERKGLSDCFVPGKEVAVFLTPRQARDTIGVLLADPARRERMAAAARERLCRDHTWQHRLRKMFESAALLKPSD
jgi:spore maturation protein CgeB